MSIDRIAFVLAGMMCAASVGAVMARPTVKIAEQGPRVQLETMIPRQFGEWREEPQRVAQIVNPQTQALLDKLYSQILSRTYINDQGYRVMLSIAYGGDQREGLRAHKPEVCYPAQGFALRQAQSATLETPYGTIPGRRMVASLGNRQEAVTYWYTIGGQSVDGNTKAKLVEMKFGLTGRIPDGLLFRVSSIDGDNGHANGMQDRFIGQLLAVLPPGDRQRLAGL